MSAGISGDCTEHLLWRVRNGKYGQSGAKTVFITIGVNNLYKKDTPTNVAEGIKAVANQAAKQFAQARIIVFGVLPFYNIEAQRQVQAALDAWDKPPRIEFHDISSSFINSAQELNGELYSGDMLHLSPAGYEMWSDIIAKLALDK